MAIRNVDLTKSQLKDIKAISKNIEPIGISMAAALRLAVKEFIEKYKQKQKGKTDAKEVD